MYDKIPEETLNRLVETFVFGGTGQKRYVIRSKKTNFLVYTGKDERDAKIYKSRYDVNDSWKYSTESLEYSKDMNAAYNVILKLFEEIPQKDIHMEHLEEEGWNVSSCYDKDAGEWENWQQSETLPRAICYMALKHVGVDLSKYV